MLSLIIVIGCAWFSREAFREGRNFMGWLNLVASAANAALFMLNATTTPI